VEQEPPRKLLDQVRDALRLKHYSYRTEQSYVDWIRRYILFHKKRHPQDMGAAEVQTFLTYLAVERKVAASTQNQALSALLFLYREVLRVELPDLTNTVRAHKLKRLLTVLTCAEVTLLISCMTGIHQLMTKLLYGSGLRLTECLRLRVKDVDFAQRMIVVRDGKGEQDRVTVLPDSLTKPIQDHLKRVKQLHEKDLEAGHGTVDLLYVLEREYPNANREWGWQYVFPSERLSTDSRTGHTHRHTCTCVASAGVTLILAVCKKPSAKRRVSPKLSSRSARIRSAACLPRTCSNPATTREAGRCRNSSVTRTSKRP